MNIFARLALAFALSFAAAGLVQQAAMLNDRANGPLSALLPLSVCILLVTAVFGLVLWRSRSAVAIGRTAVAMLAIMLVFGVTVAVLGVATLSPGIGGNIGYMMAMLVDFYFLLPSAVAVAVHWRLLHGAAAGRTS